MTLKELESEIKIEFPNFAIKYKSDSKLMVFINLFLKTITFGKMKKFMQSFITTVGHTVYVPADWDSKPETNKITVLRHERVHMRQAKKYTRFLFGFLYLFFPFPVIFAYYRMKFEREAYAESMLAASEYHGIDSIKDFVYKNKVISHFTSAEYFWAWPWRKSLQRWYDEQVSNIESKLMNNK